MIKFFRKIRQKKLTENKFGKYFLYAIGEIVLVVIGILIALYINNWNDNRLKEGEVSNYFQQIRNELEFDINHFNNDLTSTKKNIDYLDKVSEGKYNEVDLSLLLHYLPRNFDSRNFGISYKKMLEAGIIEHIKNIQLSTKLESYYLTNCREYNSGIEFHANFISDHIEGPLLLILNHKKGFLVDPKEVIEELENGKLKSLVNWQVSFFDYQLPFIEQNINQAEELIRLIDDK